MWRATAAIRAPKKVDWYSISGISDVTYGAALKVGLLQGERVGRNFRILLETLQIFHSNFIIAPTAARQLRLSNYKFVGSMKNGGKTPVAIVNKASVWKADDVLEIYPDFQTLMPTESFSMKMIAA